MTNDVRITSRNKIGKDSFDLVVVLIGFLLMFIAFFLTQQIPLLHDFFFTISRWNFNEISTLRYSVAFFIYLILIVVLYFSQRRNKKIILVIASLVFSAFLYGRFSFLLYIGSYLFYRLIYIKLRVSLKLILFFFIYEVFIFLTLNILYGHNTLFWYAYIFATLFALRFVLYIYHNIVHDFKEEPFLDYILYIFCPVFFIIFPHIVILPQYDYFTNSFSLNREGFIRSAKSGIKYFALGLLQLFICHICNIISYYVSRYEVLSIPVKIPLECICLLLIICGYGNLLLGLVKGLGYNIKSPFRNPFISRNIIDLFSRFLIYFKEYIVTMFFMPAVLFARSLGQYLRTFVSTVVAVTFGVTLHAFLSLGHQFCSIYNSNIRGIANISAGYALELKYGVGFLGLHHKVATLAMWAFVVGVILGCQLIYNQRISSAREQSLIIKKISNNKFIKFLQIVVMIITFWCMFS